MGDARTRTLRTVPNASPRLVFRTIHGYRRAFRIAGEGPAILLIHGIGDSSATWTDLIPHLAQTNTVIAPDLLGHGRSDKPRADYSVAAYANGMRDLLAVLGIERATVIGHSLGGAVAMQFAYQYPQMVERLVITSSSGVTKDVHALLRLVSVPVVNEWLRLLRLPGARTTARVAGNIVEQLTDVSLNPAQVFGAAPDIVRLISDIDDRTAYLAFLKTLRAVVDWRGQVITLLDRCYLTADLPVQIIWGAKDSVFPVSHAHIAHAAMPGSRLDIFRSAGHYPFLDDPIRFLSVIEQFLAATPPAEFDPESWRDTLISGAVEKAITGGPAARLAVLDAMESGERSAT